MGGQYQKGPNSTADSSMIGASVQSKPQIKNLGGKINQRGVFRGNHGNIRNQINNKPRYLNTIESEGNLPSQVVNTH